MATEKNMLKLKSPGVTTAEDLPKVGVNYYGIEFTRNTSNNGGTNGYHKMIGTDEMLAELPVHNMMKVAAILNAKPSQILNQINFFKDENGNNVDLAGGNGEDFMQAMPTDTPIYAIMGGTDDTYDRYIVGTEPFSYGGDVARLITPYAESIDWTTTANNQQRCIYDTGNAGSMGTQSDCITEGFENYKTSAGFPKTSTTRFNYELYARNKNSDNTKNVPYCNSLSMDLSFLMTLLFIEFRTKRLTLSLGNGVSSNVTPSASTWGTVSGWRVTEADGTVHYYNFGSTPLYVNGVSGSYIQTYLEGNRYSMTEIMEAQRDISNGCVNGTFESVTCPDGTKVQGLEDGVMTGIWTKMMKGKIMCAFEAGAEDKECDLEVCLRVPVWRGKANLYGNLFTERSGSEVLLFIEDDGTRHNYLYQARDVESVATDTATANTEKAEDWAFVADNNYEFIGDLGSTGGWGTDVIRTENGVTHPTAINTGGGRETYEGAYTSFNTDQTATNVYIRRWVVFGGNASGSASVLRYSHSGHAPSASDTNCGGGFRCKLAQ